MSRGNQPSAGTMTLVGMDAHTRILSLCIAEWRHGEDPKVKDRLPQVMLEDMEKVYESRVPKDAVTLIESSGNTRIIVRRLEAIGRRVEVLNSDILGSISERDRVNDRIDAEKLAYAYARGNSNGKTVWVPSEEYAGYRDLLSGYLRSSRDATRASNRIWAFCNSHGLPLPKRGMPRKSEKVRSILEGMSLDGNQRALVEGQLEDFEHFRRRRTEDLGRIKRAAIRRRDVLRLMQLPGIQLYIAFAIVAYVEDIRRFPKEPRPSFEVRALGREAPLRGDRPDRAPVRRRPGRKVGAAQARLRQGLQQGLHGGGAEGGHLRLVHPQRRAVAQPRDAGVLRAQACEGLRRGRARRDVEARLPDEGLLRQGGVGGSLRASAQTGPSCRSGICLSTFQPHRRNGSDSLVHEDGVPPSR